MSTKLANTCIETQGKLTQEQWDERIKYRGVDFKYPEQLEEAAACYERKIPRLEAEIERLTLTMPSDDHIADAAAKVIVLQGEFQKLKAEFKATDKADLFERQRLQIVMGELQQRIHALASVINHKSELANAELKLPRLKEKYACVVKERELREKKLVKREIHHTEYYIDLDGGDDGNGGLSYDDAWLTIEQYITTTVRSAGDIAWVRANTDETVEATINFDEDGTRLAPIEIRGCSIADDPWSDGSDVKPIIDFNGSAYYLYDQFDNFWRFYRLDIKNSNASQGLLYIQLSYGVIVDSCDIHGNINGGGNGINISTTDGTLIKDTVFYDNYGNNINVASGFIQVENCTLDGGGVHSTNYGIYVSGGVVYCRDSLLGNSDTHDNADIYVLRAGAVYLLNTKLASSTEVAMDAVVSLYSFVHSENHGQVKGAQKSWYYSGTVERDSGVQLDSLDSAKMSPNTYICNQFPLTLSGNPLQGDYQIWCPASEATITIKARETAAWAADPDNTEFYFEASYFDEAATSAHRATQASAQGLDGTDEISFTMTFTPTQAGWVYVTCYLKKYESGKYVNVSVQPTVS